MAYNVLYKLEDNIQAIRIALSWDSRTPVSEEDEALLKNMAGREGEEIQAQLPEPASIKELNGHSTSKTVPLLKMQRAV